jgi:hypothetical protein
MAVTNFILITPDIEGQFLKLLADYNAIGVP